MTEEENEIGAAEMAAAFKPKRKRGTSPPPTGGGQADGDAGQDLQRGHGGAPARGAGPKGIINKNKRGTTSKTKRQNGRERAPKPKQVSVDTRTNTGVHTRTRSAVKEGGPEHAQTDGNRVYDDQG